jgi:hypothetical protein
MSATFNALPLPTQIGRQTNTRPAAAAVGGAAPSSDVGAAAAIAAHEAKVDPHPQYETAAEVAAQIEAHRVSLDPHADRAYADALMATHNSTADVHQIADIDGLQEELDLAPFESTGAVAGFGLTIFSGTQVTVAPGTAIFITWADPAAPVQTKVAYPGANVTITGIAVQFLTYLALDSSGAIVQQSSPYTAAQRRTHVPLGVAAHVNNVSLNSVSFTVQSIHATGNQVHDVLEAIGTLNTAGNVYGANGATLGLVRSAGNLFKFGANPSYTDPHNLAIAGMTGGSFFYHTSTAAITGPFTSINVTQYESAPGVLSTVGNNNYTVQRIFLFQTGVTRIQFGQHEYPTMADAESAMLTESYVVEPNAAGAGVFRAFMIVKKNATDASNIAQVKFFSLAKFGSVSNGGTALTAANIIAALGYTPESTTALPAHVADADPHPQYETVTEVNTKIATHSAAADPHGDRAYAVAQDSAHTAAGDPHTQYVLAAGDTMTGALTMKSGSSGALVLQNGGASNTGYVEFIAPSAGAGLRQGYLGFASTSLPVDTGTLTYIAGKHQFGGSVNVGGVLASALPGRLVALHASGNPTTGLTTNTFQVGEVTGNSGYVLQMGMILDPGGTWASSVQAVVAGVGGNLSLNASGGAVTVGLPSAFSHAFTPESQFYQRSVSSTNGILAQPFHFCENLTIAYNGVVGGILAKTYRDVASFHTPAGMWFDKRNVGGVSSEVDIVWGSQQSSGQIALPTERMRLDPSGRLALGTQPYAWASATTTSIDLEHGAVASYGPNNQMWLAANIYWDGGDWRVKNAGSGAVYTADGLGNHSWFTCGSVAAGAPSTLLQRAILNQAGNMGIGTASPSVRMHLASAGSGARVRVQSTDSGGVTAELEADSNLTASFGTNTSHPLYLRTGSAERMRIMTTGAVLFGISAYNISGGGAIIDTGTAVGVSNTIAYWGKAGTPDGSIYHAFAWNNNIIGSITQAGGGTSIAYNTTSDKRLKKEIVEAPAQGAVIDAIEVKEYEFISTSLAGRKYVGVLAQDLFQIVPNAVTPGNDLTDPPQPWGVDYSKLVPLLIKELQDLRQRVAALEAAQQPI